MTTKRDIYRSGYERGFAIASWQEIPEIGESIPQHMQHAIHYDTVTDKDVQADVFYALCYDTEENDRQYTPFEFTAHELNTLQDTKPYDVWTVYDDGISQGVLANYRQRCRQRTRKRHT